MDIFLSGLGGALIGSLIGFLGAWWLQQRTVRHEEIGAARALFFEMVANAGTLRAVAWRESTGRRADTLVRTTWEATQSKVGTLLEPNDFLIVALAYDDLALWQTYIDERVGLKSLDPSDKRTLGEVADSIVEAAEKLRDRAWSKRELNNFPVFRGGAQAATTEIPASE